jgi:hypothetical protein
LAIDGVTALSDQSGNVGLLLLSHPGPTADLHRRSLASLAELPVLVHPADVDAGVRIGRVLAHVLLRSLALP